MTSEVTKAIAFVLLVLPLARAQPDAGPEPNILTKEEQKAGWRLLFDGKTTQGWRGYNLQTLPPRWEAMDGALVRTSGAGSGDIITIEQFDNFELVVEWKIGERGNSGVLIRVTEGAALSWHTAVEVQILDNLRFPHLGRQRLTGACYELYAPAKDVTRPPGEWNRFRILVDGNHVEHWLNGERVVEYALWSEDWNQRLAESKFKDKPNFARAAKGHICLQDHSERIEFRNLKIRPLPQKPRKQA
ncbi:MAG: DUF1080 domain-containing protein [Acidobacteria bacterium]|nr:DUF1080 domain-containing protein [Acidobacteriota bacterium]MCI0628219.1 DUF1080 domain-containing protein [Acidobacteriota bacterium]